VSGRVRVIPDTDGHFCIPSVVAFRYFCVFLIKILSVLCILLLILYFVSCFACVFCFVFVLSFGVVINNFLIFISLRNRVPWALKELIN